MAYRYDPTRVRKLQEALIQQHGGVPDPRQETGPFGAMRLEEPEAPGSPFHRPPLEPAGFPRRGFGARARATEMAPSTGPEAPPTVPRQPEALPEVGARRSFRRWADPYRRMAAGALTGTVVQPVVQAAGAAEMLGAVPAPKVPGIDPISGAMAAARLMRPAARAVAEQGELAMEGLAPEEYLRQDVFEKPQLLADPKWWQFHGPYAVGQMLSFLIPGAAGASAAAKAARLAQLSPKAARLVESLGAMGAASFTESMGEAAFSFRDAKQAGQSDEVAGRVAAEVFLENFPVIAGSSALSFFGGGIPRIGPAMERLPTVARRALQTGVESGQEVVQEVISTRAARRFDPSRELHVGTPAVLGAVGGLAGGILLEDVAGEGMARPAADPAVLDHLASGRASQREFRQALPFHPILAQTLRAWAASRGPEGVAALYREAEAFADPRVVGMIREILGESAQPPAEPGGPEAPPEGGPVPTTPLGPPLGGPPAAPAAPAGGPAAAPAALPPGPPAAPAPPPGGPAPLPAPSPAPAPAPAAAPEQAAERRRKQLSAAQMTAARAVEGDLKKLGAELVGDTLVYDLAAFPKIKRLIARAQVDAAMAPAPSEAPTTAPVAAEAPIPKSDKGRLIPVRDELGNVRYRTEAVEEPAAPAASAPAPAAGVAETAEQPTMFGERQVPPSFQQIPTAIEWNEQEREWDISDEDPAALARVMQWTERAEKESPTYQIRHEVLRLRDTVSELLDRTLVRARAGKGYELLPDLTRSELRRLESRIGPLIRHPSLPSEQVEPGKRSPLSVLAKDIKVRHDELANRENARARDELADLAQQARYAQEILDSTQRGMLPIGVAWAQEQEQIDWIEDSTKALDVLSYEAARVLDVFGRASGHPIARKAREQLVKIEQVRAEWTEKVRTLRKKVEQPPGEPEPAPAPTPEPSPEPQRPAEEPEAPPSVPPTEPEPQPPAEEKAAADPAAIEKRALERDTRYALMNAFSLALRGGEQLPTTASELRAFASRKTGVKNFAETAEGPDDVADALEAAVLKQYRWEVEHGGPMGLHNRIRYAREAETKLASRSRSLKMRARQQFSTPIPLAETAAFILDPDIGERILEPTAGTGNLVDAVVRLAGKVTAIELEPRRVDALRWGDQAEEVIEGDFFAHDSKQLYDAVMANPPWRKGDVAPQATPGLNQGDLADGFIYRALELLKEGGRLVAVMPEHYLENNNLIRWLKEHHTLIGRLQSPEGAYVSRGTKVGSVILAVVKGKTNVRARVGGRPDVILKGFDSSETGWQQFLDGAEQLRKAWPSPAVETTAPEGVFTKPKADAARDDLRKFFGKGRPTTEAGFAPKTGDIPPEIIRAAVELGGYKVQTMIDADGVATYTRWAAGMMEDIGEGIEPILTGVWDRMRAVEQSGLSANMVDDSEEAPDEQRPGTGGGQAPAGGVGARPGRPRGRGGGSRPAGGGGLHPVGAGGTMVPDAGELSAADVVADPRQPGGPGVTVRAGAVLHEVDVDVAGLSERQAARVREDFREAAASVVFSPATDNGGRRGRPHPRLAVEPLSLAAVQSPEVVERVEDQYLGNASDTQAHAVDLIVQAWKQRHGFLCADTVGLGKTRILLGAMRWLLGDPSGASRVIHITYNRQNVIKTFDQEAAKAGGFDYEVMRARDFKGSSRTARKKGKELMALPEASRVISLTINSRELENYEEALTDWIRRAPGPVALIVDEAHKLMNMYKTSGRGKPAQSAVAFNRIQQEVMGKGEVFYFSATPSQSSRNLAYMSGLREWASGPKGFSDYILRVTGQVEQIAESEKKAEDARQEALQEGATQEEADIKYQEALVRAGGAVAAQGGWLSTVEVEQLLREWKAKGKYLHRQMWRGGMRYRVTSPQVREEALDKVNRWADFTRRVYEAAQAYGKFDRTGGNNTLMLVRAMLNTHMKRVQADVRLDYAVDEVDRIINDADNPASVVVSLIESSEKEYDEEGLQQIGRIQAAIRTINTRKRDDEGVEDTEDYVKDPQTGDLGMAAALRARAKLFEMAESMPTVRDVVKIFREHFGVDEVALVMGSVEGKPWPEQRRIQDVKSFQEGRKRIILVSDAGSVGLDMHHEIDSGPGNRARIFMPLDYDFSAINFFQRLGRVDRADQVSSPTVVLLEMPFRSERRYITTIANRLRDLGASSHGQAGVATVQNVAIAEMDEGIARNSLRTLWAALAHSDKILFLKRGFFEWDSGAEAWVPAQPSNLKASLLDFQNDLVLMPVKDANRIYTALEKQYEEDLDIQIRSGLELETQRGTGTILRSVAVPGRSLTMHDVQDAEGHVYGILSGLVMETTALVNPILEEHERRRFKALKTPQGLIVGKRIPDKSRAVVARRLGIAKRAIRPDEVIAELQAGSKVALLKRGDSGKQWTLVAYRPKELGEGKMLVRIDGATLGDEAELKAWAKEQGIPPASMYYVPTSKWIVPQEMVSKFVEHYPIAPPSVRDTGEHGDTKAGFAPRRRPFGQGANALDPRTWFQGAKDPTPQQAEQILGRHEVVAELWGRLNRMYIVKNRKTKSGQLAVYDFHGQFQSYHTMPEHEAIWHDLGHHLQALLLGGPPTRWGQTMRQWVEQKKVDLSIGLSKDDRRQMRRTINLEITSLLKEFRPAGPQAAEAFAEFVRLLVMDDSAAFSRAPNLYRVWSKLVRDNRELADIIDWGKKQHEAWRRSPALAKWQSHLVGSQAPFTSDWERKWARMVDDMLPVKNAWREMMQARATGAPVPAAKNAMLLADTRHGYIEDTRTWMERGRFTYGARGARSGKSFREVLAPVAKRLMDWRAYVVAREAQYLKQSRGWDPNERLGLPKGVTPREILGLYENDAAVQQAARDYQDFMNAGLDYLEDAGILSADRKAAILKNNQIYTQLLRMVSTPTQGRRGRGLPGYLGRVFNPIIRRKGGPWPIVYPDESAFGRIMQIHKTVATNSLRVAFADMVEALPDGATWGRVEQLGKIPVSTDLREILGKLKLDSADLGLSDEALEEIVTLFRPDFNDPREQVVPFYRNGTRYGLRVNNRNVYDAIMASDSVSPGILLSIARKTAPLLRAGRASVVLSPWWMGRNLARDQLQAIVRSQAPKGYKLRAYPAHWVLAFDMQPMGRAILETIGVKQATIARWLGTSEQAIEGMLFKGMAYADQSHFFSMTPDQLEQYFRRHVLGQSRGKWNPIEWITAVIEAAETIGTATEYATRLQEMRAFGYDTATTRDEVLAASYPGRKVSIDFGVAGSYVREWGRHTLFLNPAIQGPVSAYDMLSNPQTRAKAWTALLKWTILPTLLLFAFNYRRKEYWDIPPEIRRSRWILYYGPRGEGFRDWYIPVPKPWELGIVANAVESLLEFVVSHEPEALGSWVGNVKEQLPLGQWMPFVPKPWLEAIFNTKFYSGAPIESPGERYKPAVEREAPTTSYAARVIARSINALDEGTGLPVPETLKSPKKVEHLMTGYFPEMGQKVLDVVDVAVSAAAGPALPSVGLPESRRLKSFRVSYFTDFGTAAIRRFYSTLQEAREKKGSEQPERHAELLNRTEGWEGIAKQIQELRRLYDASEDRDERARLATEANRLASEALDYRPETFTFPFGPRPLVEAERALRRRP